MKTDYKNQAYLKERINTAHMNRKFWTAVLFTVGAATVAAFYNFDFNSDLYTINDLIKCYIGAVGSFVAVGSVIAFICETVLINKLTEKLRDVENKDQSETMIFIPLILLGSSLLFFVGFAIFNSASQLRKLKREK